VTFLHRFVVHLDSFMILVDLDQESSPATVLQRFADTFGSLQKTLDKPRISLIARLFSFPLIRYTIVYNTRRTLFFGIGLPQAACLVLPALCQRQRICARVIYILRIRPRFDHVQPLLAGVDSVVQAACFRLTY